MALDEFPSLFKICLSKTAMLLKSFYWNPELPLSHNPFIFVPSPIIDQLIVSVAKITALQPLLSSDLRLLLKSGQVRKFILEDDEDCKKGEGIHVSERNLRIMLSDLTSACQYLTVIKINLKIIKRMDLDLIKFSLNSLLTQARNIKHIDSCIEFDLRILCDSNYLEKLVLRFPLQNNLCDLLLIKNQYRHRTSLKYVEVCDNKISYKDMADMLKYCTELVHIDYDLSRCLINLHSTDWQHGTLNQHYKIRKCQLGTCNYSGPTRTFVSTIAVRITASTCPNLESLQLSVSDNRPISAISDFQNLKALNICSESSPYFLNFTLGLKVLLEKPEFGHKLESLTIKNFNCVDFALIGRCCPNLKILIADYDREITCLNFSPTSFQNLQILKLTNLRNSDVDVNTVTAALTNAVHLKDLKLKNAGSLTDDVLSNILSKNSLLKLKKIVAPHCCPSVPVLKQMVTTLKALEIFDISLRCYAHPDIVDILHEINPRIKVGPQYQAWASSGRN